MPALLERYVVGKLASAQDEPAGYAATQFATLNVLAAVKLAVGDLAKVEAVLKVLGLVNAVRRFYAPFESDIRSGTADVYRHEMPGGQNTNLREQARADWCSGRQRESRRRPAYPLPSVSLGSGRAGILRGSGAIPAEGGLARFLCQGLGGPRVHPPGRGS